MRIKIVSDGVYSSAKSGVFAERADGEIVRIEGIREIRWRISPDSELAEAVIVFAHIPVEVEALVASVKLRGWQALRLSVDLALFRLSKKIKKIWRGE